MLCPPESRGARSKDTGEGSAGKLGVALIAWMGSMWLPGPGGPPAHPGQGQTATAYISDLTELRNCLQSVCSAAYGVPVQVYYLDGRRITLLPDA